jgi:hypothetical protein
MIKIVKLDPVVIDIPIPWWLIIAALVIGIGLGIFFRASPKTPIPTLILWGILKKLYFKLGHYPFFPFLIQSDSR